MNGLVEAGQTVNAGDEYVLHASRLELTQHVGPELRAFRPVADPMALTLNFPYSPTQSTLRPKPLLHRLLDTLCHAA